MHHGLLVAAQHVSQLRLGTVRPMLGLQQRLADAGHVAVAEDAEAAGEELAALAVAFDVLVGQEPDRGLRDGESHGRLGVRRLERGCFGNHGHAPRGSQGQPGSTSWSSQVPRSQACAGIVDDLPGPFLAGAGHHVQVVHVVAGRGDRTDRGSRAGRARRRRCAPPRAPRSGGRRAVHAVVAEPADRLAAESISIVDLLQRGLDVGVLLVVLVRRVATTSCRRGDAPRHAISESASKTPAVPKLCTWRLQLPAPRSSTGTSPAGHAGGWAAARSARAPQIANRPSPRRA